MRNLLAAGAAALLILCPCAWAAGDGRPIVDTESGRVRGVLHDGVREFRGIPYAAAPVGELRWALPRAATPWKGVQDAARFGPACPQVARYGLTEASDTEDCLTLNITIPTTAEARPRPVIVWIHGGAFVGGSTALYPLDAMARAGDAVVVSMNYRLGVFGFMASPWFAASHNGGYGLEDQRAALRWVSRNIAAFGGDPRNVTLAGESAGAASVCMHILAPAETAGLFHRAIIQSAGCTTPLPTVADASETGRKVAEQLGCTGAGVLACLRRKPVNDLLAAAAKVQGASIVTYLPATGAQTIPLPGAVALDSGRFVKVPVVYGGTRDELRLYVAYAAQAGDKVTAENYRDHLKAVYGDKADVVIREYPAGAYSSPSSALGTVWGDFRPDVGINTCIYLQTAKLMRRAVAVYQSEFADPNPPPVTDDPGFEMGAVHSSELPYFFPHFSNTTKLDGPELTAAQQHLSAQMLGYWTSFARSGRPVAADAPAWPPFRADADVMRFAPNGVGPYDASSAHHCPFWKKLYPAILTQ